MKIEKEKRAAARPPDKRIRVQFDIAERRYLGVQELMDLTHTDTLRAFFNDALTLYQWAVSQTALGNQVGSFDPDSGHFSRVQFTPFQNIPTNQKDRTNAKRQTEHNITDNTSDTDRGTSGRTGACAGDGVGLRLGTVSTTECHEHSRE